MGKNSKKFLPPDQAAGVWQTKIESDIGWIKIIGGWSLPLIITASIGFLFYHFQQMERISVLETKLEQMKCSPEKL